MYIIYTTVVCLTSINLIFWIQIKNRPISFGFYNVCLIIIYSYRFLLSFGWYIVVVFRLYNYTNVWMFYKWCFVNWALGWWIGMLEKTEREIGYEWICALYLFVDYDYDCYGYSDYRGGYSEPYYEDYYRSFEGEYFFDFAPNNVVAPTVAASASSQRLGRTNNAVGLVQNYIWSIWFYFQNIKNDFISMYTLFTLIYTNTPTYVFTYVIFHYLLFHCSCTFELQLFNQ